MNKKKRYNDYSIYTNEIIKLYTLENKTIKDINNITGVYNEKIKEILKRNNIKIKPNHVINRKNNFNQCYFQIIDCSEKAYFLGLLYADGNVYLKRNRIQITLINEDSYILEIFKAKISSTAKLYNDRSKYSKLIIDSKEMTKNLIDLGCVPQKSLILKFPTEEQVPKHLIHHFIRGYFDGDGGVTKRKNNFFSLNMTSTKEFLEEFNNVLINHLNFSFSIFKKRYNHKENSAGSVLLHEKEKVIKFLKWIYTDSDNLSIKRKNILCKLQKI